MKRHNRYTISVTGYWFQKGKLTDSANVVWDKHFTSHKRFRTKSKVESYLRYLATLNKVFLVSVCSYVTGMQYTLQVGK